MTEAHWRAIRRYHRARRRATPRIVAGASRLVLLTRCHAYKVPHPGHGWRAFLHGLLANLSEAALGRAGLPGFCPVQRALPGGWLVVMPRARPLTEAEFAALDYPAFVDRGAYAIPAEPKASSFGWLAGEVVAVDYG